MRPCGLWSLWSLETERRLVPFQLIKLIEEANSYLSRLAMWLAESIPNSWNGTSQQPGVEGVAASWGLPDILSLRWQLTTGRQQSLWPPRADV